MKLNKRTSFVPMSQCYVIKQMVNAMAYTIELWMHLGGLLSTQEARVAGGIVNSNNPLLNMHEAIAECDSYASFLHPYWLNSVRHGVYHLLIGLRLAVRYDKSLHA